MFISSFKSRGLSFIITVVSILFTYSSYRFEWHATWVGVLMAFPVDGKMKRVYVRDHPRSALAAILDNGWLVINTHLSFVPGFNLAQLRKIKRWAQKLGSENKCRVVIMGDLNLPKNLPVIASDWISLVQQNTYPSWGAKIQFDYILTKDSVKKLKVIPTTATGISDHLPITVEID